MRRGERSARELSFFFFWGGGKIFRECPGNKVGETHPPPPPPPPRYMECLYEAEGAEATTTRHQTEGGVGQQAEGGVDQQAHVVPQLPPSPSRYLPGVSLGSGRSRGGDHAAPDRRWSWPAGSRSPTARTPYCPFHIWQQRERMNKSI